MKMKMTKNVGMLLLSIWLIVYGLVHVFSLSMPFIGIVLAILAIASGIFILIGR